MAEIAVSRVAEIALGHHSKGSDRRERPALVTVEFVPVIAVDDHLAFESPWQIKIPQEDIAWIVVPFTGIAFSFPDILVAVKRVVIAWIGPTSDFNPVDFDVARIVIAVPRITPSRIVAPKHRGLPFPTGEWPGTAVSEVDWLRRDGRRGWCRDVTPDS